MDCWWKVSVRPSLVNFPETWALSSPRVMLYCWLSAGETRWMLRSYFHALSICLTINATCKNQNVGQNSLGALSSVYQISRDGKNRILLMTHPAGINHLFIYLLVNEKEDWVFFQDCWITIVCRGRVISPKCRRTRRVHIVFKCFQIFGGFIGAGYVVLAVPRVPWTQFSTTDLQSVTFLSGGRSEVRLHILVQSTLARNTGRLHCTVFCAIINFFLFFRCHKIQKAYVFLCFISQNHYLNLINLILFGFIKVLKTKESGYTN